MFHTNRRFRYRLRHVSYQPTFRIPSPSCFISTDVSETATVYIIRFLTSMISGFSGGVHSGNGVSDGTWTCCQLSGILLGYGIMQYSQCIRTFPSLGWTPHDYCCPLWTLCCSAWQQPSTSTGFHAVMQLPTYCPKGMLGVLQLNCYTSQVADYQRGFQNIITKYLYKATKAEGVSRKVWLRFNRLTETLTGTAIL